ncbi:MAG: hypothetical protein HS126_18880 [Anaerolineales bacterium]|nr:hypothetical protein [Anaerolineales bacterium]
MADYKAFLTKLTQNLNTLREREAKYGGNAPLELLNQIDDHQKAMVLTEQALNGELGETEWEEALKPLLLAVNNGQVLTLQVETFIAGDIRGDLVKGDQVFGDKIITHIYEAPPPPLPPAEAKERRDLGILLGKVKQFWIEGVLQKSVHTIALIDLGKETQLEAVAHAWEQVLELPDQSRQTLPPDKKISQIFDEMNRALLILGAPGSGKTITLLQLTRDLIHQAEQDESFSQPVPVIFNLSTWTKGQALITWLAAELSAKYQIPQRIGRPWLENNRLLPLLDGLDEVKLADRDDCVKAINQFGMEFGLSGLVVCSRLEEYISLPVRLKLNGAIRLQPLTLEQVYDYLEAAGAKLNVLRTALQVDNDLQTLAQSPLTLGIMIVAYQDIPVEKLIGQAHPTLEASRKQLLDTYVERMFRRKGQSRPYPDEQTKVWLSWLALGMMRHNQGIFLIEQLQPSWLVNTSWQWVYVLGSRSISGLIMGLVIEFIVRLTSDFILWRIGGLGLGLNYGLIGGFGGTISGLCIGLIDRIWFRRSINNENLKIKKFPTFWSLVIKSLIDGLIFGMIFGMTGAILNKLIVGATPWLSIKLAFLSLGGFMGGLILGLRSNRQSLDEDIQTVEALSWSWQKALRTGSFWLVFGIIAGLMFWLFAGTIAKIPNLIVDASIFGLIIGLILGIVGVMFGGLNSSILDTKTAPNQGMHLSLINAVIIGLFFGLPFGLTISPGLGLGIGVIATLWYGGLNVIQHYTLRLILWYNGRTPRLYAHFLDCAAERIFLQKVGGGYIFIHRLLLEHFASLEPKK